MSIRAKVLLMGEIEYARTEFYEQIEPLADIVLYKARNLEEFAELCKTEYRGITTVYHLHNPSHSISRLDSSFYDALPESCKFICHFGAGYDDVDVLEAKQRGIKVSHTPGAVDEATATTAIYLILGAMRQFAKAEISARQGNWKNGLPLARDPERKVLGIVGMGGIGQVVARRMLGWDMKIIYHNRREISPKPSFPCEYKATLDELLGEADVVSLHMPLTAQTEKSFGKKQLEMMRRDAVLVNTARGGVIDQEALIGALQAGEIYGAGLDVFPNEPEIDPRLLAFRNVSVLPHMGTETTDSRHKMGMVVLQNVLDALESRPLSNLAGGRLLTSTLDTGIDIV